MYPTTRSVLNAAGVGSEFLCRICVAIQMQSRYVLTELPLFPILIATECQCPSAKFVAGMSMILEPTLPLLPEEEEDLWSKWTNISFPFLISRDTYSSKDS